MQFWSRVVADRNPGLAKREKLLYYEMSLVFLLMLLLRRIKIHEPFKMQALKAIQVSQAHRDLAQLVPNN